MPKQDLNIVMRTTRGMLGGQIVFKERDGETYVAAPPRRRRNKTPDAEQLARQEKFTKAVEYTSIAMKDPERRKLYAAKAKRRQRANNVAFNDAYNAPEVLAIIAGNYLGQIGNVLLIQAKDDFKVNAVKVSIHNSANELIETGDAVATSDDRVWSYVATQANSNVAGSKIIATAVDLPGNEGSLELILS